MFKPDRNIQLLQQLMSMYASASPVISASDRHLWAAGGRSKLLRAFPQRRQQWSRHAVASYRKPSDTDEDKSWGELAGEAVSVVKSAASKIGKSVSNAVGALVPKKEETKHAKLSRDEEWEQGSKALYRRGQDIGSGLFGGGLVGRSMGALLGSAIRGAGQQLREASRQAANIQQRAALAIQSDARVLEKLGGSCVCDAPVSQSSMTQVVNGSMSKRVSLVIPVVGANGKVAQAEVNCTEGGRRDELSIAVVMPDRRVINIEVGAGTGAGGTIDVDWREVK